MKDLMIKEYNGVNVTDSREVATMVGKRHTDLLRSIDNYNTILLNAKMRSVDFFIESTYKDNSGKENKCYLLTKQGCEMVANKMTGEKGVLFTATYVQAFNKMEQQQKPQLPKDYLSALKSLVASEEEKQKLLEQAEKDKPFVELAKERIAKGDKISLTDITKSLKLKRGQISTYLKSNGYIHKTNTEINKKGEGMFGIYREGGFKCIGILEKGIDFINDNLEEIKMTKCRKCK